MAWSRDEKKEEISHADSRLILVYSDHPRHQDQPTPTKDAAALPDTDPACPPSTQTPASDPKELAALLCVRFELEELEDPDSEPVLYWLVSLLTCVNAAVSDPS